MTRLDLEEIISWAEQPGTRTHDYAVEIVRLREVLWDIAAKANPTIRLKALRGLSLVNK